MKRRSFPARRMGFTIGLVDCFLGQLADTPDADSLRTSMMTQRYPMGICCLVSIFTPWNPLFSMIGCWKTLSGRSDCSSHVLPHAALPSTCGTWRQCGGAVSCESFVKLSMLGAQTLLQLMAHGSWLKPCTGCEFSAARWLALCHWVQTFTPTSSDHICEPNAEILAAAPQLGFDMFLFGGWWKLAELFGRHVQYIFKFQDVSSRFGAHQGTRELQECPENDLSLRGLRGLWTISVPNSGKRYGELLQKAMRRCLFFETAFVKPLGAASCQSTS